MSRRNLVSAVPVWGLWLGLWLGLAAPGSGQLPSGNLSGRVVLEDGTPVPGVQVEVRAIESGVTRTWITGADGSFRFHSLPVGPHELTVQLEGFTTVRREVEVRMAARGSLEVTLSVDSVEDVLTVTSESPILISGRVRNRPSWNSWLEVRGAEGEPVERLEPGEHYDFHLDLAALAYRLAGVASADAGPGLIEELERVLAEGRTALTARVRPVLVGRAVRLVGDRLDAESWHRGGWVPATGESLVPMEIRLAQLDPDGGEVSPVPAGGPGWRRAADLARAGGVRFPVEAVEPGCAAITLSIWNEDGRLPLDHVVHTVRVGDADCRPADPGSPLSRGFVTLLHDTAGTAVQGALHLFEVAPGVSGGAQTVAVYVPQDPAGGCDHYAWTRRASLSRYLFQQRSFRGTLRRAWSDEGARYSDLARQLRRLLFPRRPDGDCGGWAALGALRRLASSPGRTLFVRVVDAANRSLFVPLRLLFTLEAEDAAEGSGRAFAEAPALRQPLPLESYGPPEHCVGSWSFLLPPELHGYGPRIEPPAGVAEPELIGDLDELRELTDDWWGVEPGDRAVGLVILAHHVDGVLTTDDPDDPFLWTELEDVRVPRGSVALLSACATGDPTRSRELVGVLARAGFDTVILSPFDVHTPFGVDLARNFSRRVVEGMAAGGGQPIADLWADALSETVAAFEPALAERARGMALEFLLAGHGGQRLCPGEER